MSDKIRRYETDAITVTYDLKRCIHAEECIRGLPTVFNPKARIWIQPENAPADAIAQVITCCPSGALHFQRKDGGAPETPPPHNTVTIAPDGPLYVHGDLEIIRLDGSPALQETRVALCRCGASQNKPFCDNSHLESGFCHDGTLRQNDLSFREDSEASGKLIITPTLDGSYKIEGQVELRSADGQVLHGNHCWLCRCGGSGNKPFCDGTHRKIGFVSE